MSVLTPTGPVGTGAVVSKGPKRWYKDFAGSAEPMFLAASGAAASGTTGARNVVCFPGQAVADSPLYMGFNVLGLGQTILGPAISALGVDISQDQTNDEGVEYSGPLTGGGQVFTVGTDPAFYLSVKVRIEDVSGADPFIIGFRKQEAARADFNDYDEGVWIGIVGTAGDIKINTILNNAATVVTDTTQDAVDATSITFKVSVSAAGVVTYQINGAAPTTTAAFTFDTGEVLIPSIYFLHGIDIAGTVQLETYDCGHT